MARFAWQRLMGTAGFVQWKLLTVSGFVRRKPRGWQDSRDNSHRVRQESPSGSRPPPSAARFVPWESLPPPGGGGKIRPVGVAEHVEICPVGVPEGGGGKICSPCMI